MVLSPSEYAWSSYGANGLGKDVKLLTPHQAYIDLGKSAVEQLEVYRSLFNDHLDADVLENIRLLSNKGMAIGSDNFKSEIEILSGRRVYPLRRGPKPKQKDSDFE